MVMERAVCSRLAGFFTVPRELLHSKPPLSQRAQVPLPMRQDRQYGDVSVIRK